MGARLPETPTRGPQGAELRATGRRRAVDPGLLDVETQLMLRVREGDRDAANVLIRRHFPRVARYVARIVRNERTAEDLAQDVFLRVFTHAAEYEPTARFETWLYRIATNRALNHLRLSDVRRQISGSLSRGAEAVADGSDQRPERRLRLAELKREVADALAGLPVRQRVAVTLFEYEEMSYEQIGEILGASVESVRALLTRGRVALRRRLEGLL